MKRSIENQIYKKMTKEEAEILSKTIVESAKDFGNKYNLEKNDPNSSPYPFAVGALQTVLTEILRQSKVPIWVIEEYSKKVS